MTSVRHVLFVKCEVDLGPVILIYNVHFHLTYKMKRKKSSSAQLQPPLCAVQTFGPHCDYHCCGSASRTTHWFVDLMYALDLLSAHRNTLTSYWKAASDLLPAITRQTLQMATNTPTHSAAEQDAGWNRPLQSSCPTAHLPRILPTNPRP